jgi:hypothetical protein
LGNVRDQQPTWSQRLRHHPQRRVIIRDLSKALDRDDRVVDPIPQALGQICLRELDVIDSSLAEPKARTLEQFWSRVDADNRPAAVATSDRFGKNAVPTPSVKQGEWIVTGKALERTNRQLEPQAPRGCQQAKPPVETCAG